MSESIIAKLSHQQMEEVRRRGLFEGTYVSIEHFEGTYLAMTKKLYYANRLQLTPNPYMQPIYAYAMVERSPYRWTLSLITDRPYRPLGQLENSPELASPLAKVGILKKVGRALLALHSNLETYSGLNLSTVLIDSEQNVVLSAAIEKEIPPHVIPADSDQRLPVRRAYLLAADLSAVHGDGPGVRRAGVQARTGGVFLHPQPQEQKPTHQAVSTPCR